MENTINVSIGSASAVYHIMETDAPTEYDGFGTFCVCEVSKLRTVLIREEHLTWQQARYGSGFHSCDPSSFATEDISQTLWRRVQGRTDS